jgi:hypothetical protein
MHDSDLHGEAIGREERAMNALSKITARRQEAGARYQQALRNLMDAAAELDALDFAFLCASAGAGRAALPDGRFSARPDFTNFRHPEFAPITQKDNEDWQGSVVNVLLVWLKVIPSFYWKNSSSAAKRKTRLRS